ncbi:MAG: hypothetical protein GF363_01565 [Chitinivibrionales bacterium]|nr:hypothetical protein [Chitinivibrionales bacterium]
MIVQVFSESDRNSPLIAMDIFRNMGIPAGEKKFLIMYGDSRGSRRLRANHLTPLSREGFGGEDNSLDYYGIHRMIDALTAYTFYGDGRGKAVALGKGTAHECDMGIWCDGIPVRRMIATDDPEPYLRKGIYLNAWKSPRNPRLEASKFRKARKIFLYHWAKKVAAVFKQGRKAVENALEDEDSVNKMHNPITKGYGSPGAHAAVADSFPSRLNEGAWVHVFRPEKVKGRSPVVFLFPGYSANHPNEFAHLIEHVVSRGMAVVFSPYAILPVADDSATVTEKHKTIYAGMIDAVKRYAPYLDTSRIGFFGQSFGAGAVPGIAYRCLTDNGWGKKGAFIFLAAPWYTYGITSKQYASFPKHVKLIVQIYDDDRTNDHQIAVDVFNSMNIPSSEKDFAILYSDSIDGFTMSANHFVPYGNNNLNGQENLLDYYGVFKLTDALADYAFNGDKSAKEVALAGGGDAQQFMGNWSYDTPVRPMEVTDEPQARYSQLRYLFAWDNPINPRR